MYIFSIKGHFVKKEMQQQTGVSQTLRHTTPDYFNQICI